MQLDDCSMPEMKARASGSARLAAHRRSQIGFGSRGLTSSALSGRRGCRAGTRRTSRRRAPLNFEDHTGFQPIFDGTMKNWDGDPAIWKAEGNVLVGTTTAENPLKENTFVIWRAASRPTSS